MWQHLLWYMEKERNWFLNIWYMSPSGLQRKSAGWGTWGWQGTASPACTREPMEPWPELHGTGDTDSPRQHDT